MNESSFNALHIIVVMLALGTFFIRNRTLRWVVLLCLFFALSILIQEYACMRIQLKVRDNSGKSYTVNEHYKPYYLH